MPLPFTLTQGRQRIDCFPTLADCEHECILVHRNVAVPEFAGELDLSRDLGEAFDQTFPHSGCVESSPTGG
jgi:hypothetical protein